jgi:hypothetical protein
MSKMTVMCKDISKLLAKTPKLKGRQIAKELGLDKKTVNSLLYKNKSEFEVDDENRWINISNLNYTLTFPKTWTTAVEFENVIKELTNTPKKEINNVVIVIPKKCKILLIATARLLSLLNQLANNGINISIDLTKCEDTLRFFNRTGFYDYLHDEVIVLPEKPKESLSEKYQGNSDSLVELGKIEPKERNKSLIVKLGECFVLNSSKSYELAAKTVFSELIGNVSEHSESPLPGFAAMQLYKGRAKHIQTVVSDSGKGVAATLRTTLKEHHPDLYAKYVDTTISNDIELVAEAFTRGEVSRHGKGRGLGFKSSREHATKYFAKISIRQSTFSVELKYEDGELIDNKVIKDLFELDGTHICFDFYID